MPNKKSNKDSTSNLFNRYLWLVDLIFRKKKISFEEINEYWQRSSLNISGDDIPLRTFHNHRKAIEQMFDIIIECDKRDDYQYYIEDTENVELGSVRRWLLNTFTINNLINESHKLNKRILLEQIPSGQIFLTTIIEAMKENLSIEIAYQSFWRDTPYTLEIHPYCVKVFRQRWYVLGYNLFKEQLFVYALDRIQNISVTDNKFMIPHNFDGEYFFSEYFGVIIGDDKKVEKVLIKVNANQNQYIRTLPLHHSQKEEVAGSDYSIFSYSMKPTFDFIQELLYHGSYIEVLSPKWFRDEIKQVTKDMNDRYENANSINSKQIMPIHYSSIDNVIEQFENKHLIIILGRPAMGKTSMGLSIANTLEKKLLFISLEMSKEQLEKRNKDMYGKNNYSFAIDHKSRYTISDLMPKIEYHVNNNSVEYVIIDYFQLIETDDKLQFIETIKTFAKRLNIKIIVLSQIATSCSKEWLAMSFEDKIVLNEKYNSWVDMYTFIYRPSYYKIYTDEYKSLFKFYSTIIL